MKNDYNRYDFWIQRNNDKISYYICIHKIKIKVSREIYAVCRNSYRKKLRDMKRDKHIYFCGNMDISFSCLNNKFNNDIVLQIHKKFLKHKLYYALNQLSFEDRMIVIEIYFYEKTERELANLLHIPFSTLHYRKMKILKKLRVFFEQEEL
ncbi:hypothetical protein [[Eubacterium] hominis]|uniref:hypothetical protein n=1 Tax=[Eubacterium] hominis TaxID=2764325 RepID=UPI003A4E4FE1